MASNGVADERSVQKSYWDEHSKTPTIEEMMLDSKASYIDKEERPEVMAMLGDMKGKRILELGAGIGRFSGQLAAAAESVLAVDFMGTSIAENRRLNAGCKNLDWQVADATQIDFEAGSFDVVFSNWLLMYLSDEEVALLANRILRWLVPGGVLFFRESCFRQSGDKARSNNPTHYRNPRQYFTSVDAAHDKLTGGHIAHFQLVSCKCVDTYVRLKSNQNQICWKWTKVVGDDPQAEFRHFLDSKQYTSTGILRYERIFGPGFVSTGGLETTKEFVSMLDLQPGQAVLDVGCGIGGGDFYMATQYGAEVHGIDLSVNMVLIALERAAAAEGVSKTSFEIADCTKKEFPLGSFDVVYSRDTILHIDDKSALFSRFLSWLKPGGKLLISDYCRSSGQPSEAFAAYIKQRGYDLHSVEDYGAMIKDAGFVDVLAEDRTRQFESCLTRELDDFEKQREEFQQEFSPQDYEALVSGWQDKLERVAGGEQRWGLFFARKPAA